MIKAIFFDFANVLATEGFSSGIAEYENEHSLTEGKLYAAAHDHAYWKDFSLGKISEMEYLSSINETLGGNLDIVEFKEKILTKFIPNDDLLEFIRTLKDKYKLGVISNSPKEWFDHYCEKFGLPEIFDVMVASGFVGLRKPGVEIFKYAINKAEVTGEESIYIDDRPDRVDGARELGMKIIAYNNLLQLKKEISTIVNANL
jgi:putative hydrolase of the HAD superfamily